MNLTSRWSVKCAACGAAKGERCLGSRGQPRASVYRERWDRKLSKDRERKSAAEFARQ